MKLHHRPFRNIHPLSTWDGFLRYCRAMASQGMRCHEPGRIFIVHAGGQAEKIPSSRRPVWHFYGQV